MNPLYRIGYRIGYSIMAQSPRKVGLMRSVASEHWQTFGAELRSLRETKGFGLRQCARAIPLTSGYECNLEYGLVAPPSVQVIYRMAEVLEMNWLRVLQMGLTSCSIRRNLNSPVRINLLHMRPAHDAYHRPKSRQHAHPCTIV